MPLIKTLTGPLLLVLILWFAPTDKLVFSDLTSLAGDIPTDWPVYRNEEYGFEFHYPPRWRVLGFKRQPDHFYFGIQGPELAAKTVRPFEKQNLSVIVQIYEPPLAKNFEGRNCRNAYEKPPHWGKCLDKYVEFKGVKAVRKTYKVPQDENILSRDYDFIEGGRMYHFYTGAYSNGESLEELNERQLYIDKIVSTFRFFEK